MSEQRAPELRRALGAINRHGALNSAMLVCMMQSEVVLVQQLMGNDIAAAARFLSTTASVVGLAEFLTSPTIGKWSDTHGRRLILLASPAWATVGSILAAFCPRSVAVIAANRCITWSLVNLAGSNLSVAAVADCSAPGQDLAVNTSKFYGDMGVGFVGGPILGGLVLARSGNPAHVYLLRAAIALLELIHDLIWLPETLGLRERCAPAAAPAAPAAAAADNAAAAAAAAAAPPAADAPARRPPLTLVNPFRFLKLLTGTPVMAKLCAASWLAAWTEGKNTTDMLQLWMRNDVGLTPLQAKNFTVLYGCAMITSGRFISPGFIRWLGPRGYTHVALLANACGYALWSSSSSVAALLGGLIVKLPGFNAASKNAMQAAATEHAEAAGIGLGEFAGLFNNFRALNQALVPFICGRIYASLVGAGRSGGRAWLVLVALGSLLPELIHCSVPQSQWRPS